MSKEAIELQDRSQGGVWVGKGKVTITQHCYLVTSYTRISLKCGELHSLSVLAFAVVVVVVV